MLEALIKKIRFELQFNNTSYYKRIKEKLNKKYYQSVVERKIQQLRPIVLKGDGTDLTLAILSNKKNFSESVLALYSFAFWESNIQIHYHEDGTLSDADIEILKKVFPGITVYRRNEQNIEVKNYLDTHKLVNCSALRDHFIFSLRLFDMLIHKQTRYLLQIDSDVLFFQRPQALLDIVKNKSMNGCYNRDRINAYSYSEETIKKYLSKDMLQQFNAGVFMHNFDEEFFKFIENILLNEQNPISPWHVEQTLFAMYASEKGNFLELPKEYDLARIQRNLGTPLISEHYVHNTGSDLHRDFVKKLFPIYQKG